jgi:hypothetical protein
MPIRVIKRSDVPAAKERGMFRVTDEWMELMQKLVSGLAPHEAVEVTLSPDTKNMMGVKSPEKTFLNNLRHHLKRNKMSYDAVLRTEGGKQFICVVGR